jgi:hypothetical protein
MLTQCKGGGCLSVGDKTVDDLEKYENCHTKGLGGAYVEDSDGARYGGTPNLHLA